MMDINVEKASVPHHRHGVSICLQAAAPCSTSRVADTFTQAPPVPVRPERIRSRAGSRAMRTHTSSAMPYSASPAGQ